MEFDSVGYFEDVAKRLKLIGHSKTEKHFFRSTSASYPRELENSLSSARYPALVVVTRKDGRLIDNSSDNYLDKKLYTFLILHPAKDSAPAKIDECMALSINIFRKITGKLKRDKKKDYSLAIQQQIFGLRGLDIASISYQQIGPMLDNLYGLMVRFSIIDSAHLQYDAEDWLTTEDNGS